MACSWSALAAHWRSFDLRVAPLPDGEREQCRFVHGGTRSIRGKAVGDDVELLHAWRRDERWPAFAEH
jgi:hypothetical protein